jgi:ribosomal protein L40E
MPEKPMSEERLKAIEVHFDLDEEVSGGERTSVAHGRVLLTEVRRLQQVEQLQGALRLARPHLPTDEAFLCACGVCLTCGVATPYAAMEVCGKCAVQAVDAALRGEQP